MCGIRVPPLAERRAEIPLLAKRFLDGCPEETKVQGPARFQDRALARLEDGDYPGNARQLHGVVVYAYLMAAATGASEVRPADLPEGLCPHLRYERRGDPVANRRAIEQALERTSGNVKAAARVLGVSRGTVTTVLRMRREG
jgi:DNA-binding NtrC family response regulator